MVYVTLDFGSSNSGALLNPIGKGYNRDELIYLHARPAIEFTKQPTEFWIKKELLKSFHHGCLDSLRVYSCVYSDQEYSKDPNFIWCWDQIKDKIMSIYNSSEWVRFRHPKMALYNKESNYEIKGSDGKNYNLSVILTIFFSVIKKECLHVINNQNLHISESEINWIVTAPGMAIWEEEPREFMRSYAKCVFGQNVVLYSEPECALVGVKVGSGNFQTLKSGSYLLVADLGGGTSDFSVMKVKVDEQTNKPSFEEIKATSGEKDPTTSIKAGGNDIERNFIVFFCNKLASRLTLSDSPVQLFWKEFEKAHPLGAMDFIENWQRQFQYTSFEEKGQTVYFSPGRDYLRWLEEHYASIAKCHFEIGYCEFETEKLLKDVFHPVYDKITKALKEIEEVLKERGIDLDQVLFAGGLSLDKRLSESIKKHIRNSFKFADYSKISKGVTVGAIQSGGNHIAVTDGLIRRTARKTFYTDFVLDYDGNEDEFKKNLYKKQRTYYRMLDNNLCLSEEVLEEEYQKQRQRMHDNINNTKKRINYILPMCLKFAPLSQKQKIRIFPAEKGQTNVCIAIYSSDKNLLFFPGDYDDIHKENSFEYNFGFSWEEAELVFDPTSNPVEGNAIIILNDANGRELHKENIINAIKEGL